MKRIFFATIALCILLCSCNSPVDDGDELTTPPNDTTPAVTTSATEETTPVSVETYPVEPSVYDVLAEYFSHWSPYGCSAVVVTSAYDLLDVYRYIMSEDAQRWTSMHEEIVEGSAYNDYLNNTYTPDFFGYGGQNYDNYLIAVMIKSNNASDRYSVAATADADTISISVKLAPSHTILREDGGLFIYLVPMEGKYAGQELIISH